MPRGCAIERRPFAMPVPVSVMAESMDHQKRFKAAVDVIHNLPKNGSYRPSYEVMLRFYSLYKQAVCGPCTVSRPGFWDPVGRYKWDAWNRLGNMNSESAMAAYVEEMKKVAQEVIDTMPMNEKTASLFHHFEPLYVVIDDMPRPPTTLLDLRDIKCTDKAASLVEFEQKTGTQKEPVPEEELAMDLVPAQREESESRPIMKDVPLADKVTDPEEVPGRTQLQSDNSAGDGQEPVPELIPSDGAVMPEVLLLTSDSESEIFVDSVDSVELLENIQVVEIPKLKSNGLHNGHEYSGSSSFRSDHMETAFEVTQVGSGKGGEGAGNAGGPPMRRSREAGRDGLRDQRWREREEKALSTSRFSHKNGLSFLTLYLFH